MKYRKAHARGLMGKAAVAVAAALAVVAVTAGFALGWSSAPSYAWYDEDAQTYVLQTRQDFLGFMDLVNGTAAWDVDGDGVDDPVGAVSFAGKTVQLGADIDLRNEEVPGVGAPASASFDGTFDGAGHTISNARIVTLEEGCFADMGLFAQTGAASTIMNLRADAVTCSITVAADEPACVQNVGVIGGNVGGALLSCQTTDTCRISITHLADTTEAVPYAALSVGGVAGVCRGDIIGNENAAEVAIAATGKPYKEADGTILYPDTVCAIGGVVGSAGDLDWSFFRASERVHGELADCANYGEVKVMTPLMTGAGLYDSSYVYSFAVGGVAGYARCNMDGCLNAGYVNTDHGRTTGGVVGAFRYPRGIVDVQPDEQGDEGTMFLEGVITLSNSQNTGDVCGFARQGGIAGGSGSYTLVTSCVNGDFDWARSTFVLSSRANKPTVAGIVAKAYGNISFCENLGTVAPGSWDVEHESIIPTTGFYSAGICGMLGTWVLGDGSESPEPTLSSCLNLGNIMGIAGNRYRAIVGENGYSGPVYDNLALEGTAPELSYGENEAGVMAFVSAAALQANTALTNVDNANGRSPLEILNGNVNADDPSIYYALPANGSGKNKGFPVLAHWIDWDRTDVAGGTFTQVSPAPYRGVAGAVPVVTGTVGATTLVQDVDFVVVPQPDAIERSDGMAYTATIKGIGAYTGQTTMAYSIEGKIDLASCRISIAKSKQFNWEPQMPAKSEIKVIIGTASDGTDILVPDDQWEIAEVSATTATVPLVDGAPVNAGTYAVTVRAAEGAEDTQGENAGTYIIGQPSMRPTKLSGDAPTVKVTALECPTAEGGMIPWVSQVDQDAANVTVRMPYTGHPILPAVTAEFMGRPLGIFVRSDYTFEALTCIAPVSTEPGVPNQLQVIWGSLADETASDDDDSPLASVGDDYNIGSPDKATLAGVVLSGYRTYSNYQGSDGMLFIIDPSIAPDLAFGHPCEAQDDDAYVYAGQAVEPLEHFVYLGSYLTEGVDYTVVYEGNDRAGTAAYTVVPAEGSRFTGSFTGTFEVRELVGEPLKVQAVGSTVPYGYDEGALAVDVAVEDDGAVNGLVLQWYAVDEEGVETAVAQGSGTRFELPVGLDAGTYRFRCRAVALSPEGAVRRGETAVVAAVVEPLATTVTLPEPACVAAASTSLEVACAVVEPADLPGEFIEYALATTDEAPGNGAAWQTSRVFTGLDEGTVYYAFARIAASVNYGGSVSQGVPVATAVGLPAEGIPTGVVYDPLATLADWPLTGEGWAWADPAVTPSPLEGSYPAFYAIPESDWALDFSAFGDAYDEAAHRITVMLPLAVQKAVPAVTELPQAAALELGQPLGASELTGGAAVLETERGTTPVEGVFSWADPAEVLEAGQQERAVVFTPTGALAGCYERVEAIVAVEVAAAPEPPAGDEGPAGPEQPEGPENPSGPADPGQPADPGASTNPGSSTTTTTTTTTTTNTVDNSVTNIVKEQYVNNAQYSTVTDNSRTNTVNTIANNYYTTNNYYAAAAATPAVAPAANAAAAPQVAGGFYAAGASAVSIEPASAAGGEPLASTGAPLQVAETLGDAAVPLSAPAQTAQAVSHRVGLLAAVAALVVGALGCYLGLRARRQRLAFEQHLCEVDLEGARCAEGEEDDLSVTQP